MLQIHWTKDAVAAYLAENDIEVHAIRGVSNDEFFKHLNLVLDTKPDITMDDGADLVNLLHTSRRFTNTWIYGRDNHRCYSIKVNGNNKFAFSSCCRE